MKLEKDEVGTWITDRYGVKIYLDDKEAEQLKKELDTEEMVLKGIDIKTFAFWAMDRKSEFVFNGTTWIIGSFNIENNEEKRPGIKGVLLGRCLATCTIYDKETGCKYHGIFLKSPKDKYYNLRLVAKENV